MCTVELCNGLDDDCDGVVDDGCPAGLLPGSAVQRAAIGDSFGGTDFADTCADDELLVGLNVAAGPWVDQVTAICQEYSLFTNTQPSPFQYSLALHEKRSLDAHPSVTMSPIQELACASGKIMVGLRVSQQHTAFGDPSDAIVIPRVWIRCAEPTISLGAGTPQVVWQNALEVGPVSGSFASDQAWFEGDQLSESELLVGFHGRAGGAVARVGLTGSSLKVSLHPE